MTNQIRLVSIFTGCFILASVVPAGAQSTATSAPHVSEVTAIKAQTGCYHVTFDSKETSVSDPKYPIRSPDYFEEGTEWITVESETSNRIELQHVLLQPGGGLKHWNQIWRYEPTSSWGFQGDNLWTRSPVADSKAKWAQYVGQVDDSPRYECVAAWYTEGFEPYWDCTTWAPLPRREFSKRSDYNVLERGNRHLITLDGWIHEQHNRKLLVSGGKVTEIARELTINTYKKIDDVKCADAVTWWATYQPVWAPIKTAWASVLETESVLSLKSKVAGETLWMRLFALADEALTSPLDAKTIEARARQEIQKFRN